MSHKSRLYVFAVLLTIIGLVFNLGNVVVSAASSDVLNSEALSTLTSTQMPTMTSTPSMQMGVGPEAWLDAAIDPEQFGPMEALTIHFNTRMSLESSPHPILSWPNVDGVHSWDNTHTILTFTPSSALDSRKTYTFFLDPALRSTDGKTMKGSVEWTVHVQRGPKVQSVSPQPGSLDQRYRLIEVHFDRKMKSTISQKMVSIEPRVDFKLNWAGNRILQVILQQPLDPDQRYDLTLNGGSNQNALFAADGSYLAEDYRWFYWQKPFEIKAEMLTEKTLTVKFNYVLDQDKSGQPFSISPLLDGEWKWFSSQEIRFTAREPIPASKEFTLELVQPLVDSNGFETSTIPTISFTGIQPVRLVNSNIVRSEYSDYLVANLDVQDIRIEFSSPVNHVSAEKTFSLPSNRQRRHKYR